MNIIHVEPGRLVLCDWCDQDFTESQQTGGFMFSNYATGPCCAASIEKQVDATALLAMEREEMVDTVIASYFDASRKRGSGLIRFASQGYRYLVAKNSFDEGFYLVWGGITGDHDLTEDVYEACVDEGEKEGLKPLYHIYSRFNLFSTPGVYWYQIPDRILAEPRCSGTAVSRTCARVM